jgi:predicted nucleic acid-binding Zn ribbon protein
MKHFELNGKVYSQRELCKEFDISEDTFSYRLRRGMTVEEALKKEFTKSCVICGKTFTHKRPDAKYCSEKCTSKSKREAKPNYEGVCVVCGKPFTNTSGHVIQTCSKDCMIKRVKQYHHDYDKRRRKNFEEKV